MCLKPCIITKRLFHIWYYDITLLPVDQIDFPISHLAYNSQIYQYLIHTYTNNAGMYEQMYLLNKYKYTTILFFFLSQQVDLQDRPIKHASQVL